MNAPTQLDEVVLVGRTNVGKSTLFNRLIGEVRALVSPQAGTTRDRNHGLVQWQRHQFWAVDTAGIDPDPKDPAAKATARLLELALKRARVILFLVDAHTGFTPSERTFARGLQKRTTPTILVINKVDRPSDHAQLAGASLGFPRTALISAQNGSGVGDLLEQVCQLITLGEASSSELKIALLGQTNVGKSSLFNRLLGEERSLVLASPHTTRDRLHATLADGTTTLELIDTAGLRRQLQQASKLEQQSGRESHRALDLAQVALLVLDGSAPLTWQDQRLGELITEARVAAVVVLNKADLVTSAARAKRLTELERWLPMLKWAEVLWVSAITGGGAAEVVPAARRAATAWQRELSPLELSQSLSALERKRILANVKFKLLEQVATEPPVFVLHIATKERPPWAMVGLTESVLRQRFGFVGTPLIIKLRGNRQS